MVSVDTKCNIKQECVVGLHCFEVHFNTVSGAVSLLSAQFVKLASLPSWRQISSALDVMSRFTRHVHSSASGQYRCLISTMFFLRHV